MNIGIAITDPQDITARAFLHSCEQSGITARLIDLRKVSVNLQNDISYYTDGVNLKDLDTLIVRDAGAGAFEGVSLRFDILRQLEAEGINVINSPEAIRNAANKYHASCLLAKAGLPVPETKVVQDTGSAMEIFSTIKDCVIKPVFGYKGIGIWRIRNSSIYSGDGKLHQDDLNDFTEKLLKQRGMLYIQNFINNPGRDIRAFVINNEVIGAIYRNASEGWINNLSQGGQASKCILSPEQKEICVKAARTLGTFFAGVDLIEEEDKSYILEVNGTPSIAGIYNTWGINAADLIIEQIMEYS